MTDEELYHILFNAITDAVEAMKRMDFGKAREILIAAQQKTEEAYIARKE